MVNVEINDRLFNRALEKWHNEREFDTDTAKHIITTLIIEYINNNKKEVD